MKILADCHTHSNTSPDAADSINDMCAAALDRGLTHITFCNHYEIFPGRGTVQEYMFDFQAYSDEIERARDRYGDRLTILKGVEFGQPHRHPKEFEALLKQDYDNVTVSLHAIPAEISIFWLWIDLAETRREGRWHFLETYFDEMRALAETVEGYNVLAHFDWMKNCYPEEHGFRSEIADIMKLLAAKDIALEINTKGFRDMGEQYPATDILSLYRAAGGQRVTFGSDAHRVEDVAGDFERVAAVAEPFGFDWGYFRQRRFVSLNKKFATSQF